MAGFLGWLRKRSAKGAAASPEPAPTWNPNWQVLRHAYWLDDAELVKFDVLPSAHESIIYCHAPIHLKHPEYRKTSTRANFQGESIYLDENWRSVEVRFSGVHGVRVSAGSLILPDGTLVDVPWTLHKGTMAMRKFSLAPLPPEQGALRIVAEELIVEFQFERAEWRELQNEEMSGILEGLKNKYS